MNRVISLVAILLGILALSFYGFLNNKQTGYTSLLNFSTETKAECEELGSPYCHYICHDNIILHLEGNNTISNELPGYACHDEAWKDPRLNN